MRQEQIGNLVVRHSMPFIADDDLLGSAESAEGDRRFDVHRLRVKGIPDQLSENIDQARALHLREDRVPSRAYLLRRASAGGGGHSFLAIGGG